jgi:hypothetical protein
MPSPLPNTKEVIHIKLAIPKARRNMKICLIVSAIG